MRVEQGQNAEPTRFPPLFHYQVARGVPPGTFSSNVKEPVDEVDALNSVSAGLKIIERENVLRVVVRKRL